MDARPRLAICIAAFEFGGQATIIEQEVLHLGDAFDITIITHRADRQPPPGAHLCVVPQSTAIRRGRSSLSGLLATFDLVHCIDSLVMMIAATLSGTPFVVTSVGIAPLRLRNTLRSVAEGAVTLWAYPHLYRRAARVVAISDYIAEWVSEHASTRPVTIRLGATLRERGVRPSQRTLLYLGEVSRRKRVLDLLDGIHAAPADVELDIVGRVVGNIADRVRNHPASRRVRLHGELAQHRVEAMLSSCWAVCSASPWEGFGLPVLEGFAHGRPSIVRGQGGMEEQIKLSRGGASFQDASELARCIDVVDRDWDSYSARAFAYASTQSWEVQFQRYEQMFAELFDG